MYIFPIYEIHTTWTRGISIPWRKCQFYAKWWEDSACLVEPCSIHEKWIACWTPIDINYNGWKWLLTLSVWCLSESFLCHHPPLGTSFWKLCRAVISLRLSTPACLIPPAPSQRHLSTAGTGSGNASSGWLFKWGSLHSSPGGRQVKDSQVSITANNVINIVVQELFAEIGFWFQVGYLSWTWDYRAKVWKLFP